MNKITRETGWSRALEEALAEKNKAEILAEGATTGRMLGDMTPEFEPGLYHIEHRRDIQVVIRIEPVDGVVISITCVRPLAAWQALRHVLAGVPLIPTTSRIKALPTLTVKIR